MATYCFICSAARSGSTLLDMLIGGHSSSASLGEFSFLGKAIALNQKCSCGEDISDCDYWRKVIERVKTDLNIDLLNNPYGLRQWDTKAGPIKDEAQETKLYRLGARFRSALCDMRYSVSPNNKFKVPLAKSLSQGVKNTLSLFKIIEEEWQVNTIIDSSKNIHKAISVYQAVPDKVKVIYLTRDGRGVFYSRRNSGVDRKESLMGWRDYNKRATRLLFHNIASKDLLLLKYEDLVSDLDGQLEKICNFLGMPYEPTMQELEHGERHLVNGNKTMYQRDKGVKLDQRWIEGLSEPELAYFTKHCGKINSQLGYS